MSASQIIRTENAELRVDKIGGATAEKPVRIWLEHRQHRVYETLTVEEARQLGRALLDVAVAVPAGDAS